MLNLNHLISIVCTRSKISGELTDHVVHYIFSTSTEDIFSTLDVFIHGRVYSWKRGIPIDGSRVVMNDLISDVVFIVNRVCRVSIKISS